MEGFSEHTDILKGASGRDAACVWAVVQLDYDERSELSYAIYGTMLAEMGVRSKRAELRTCTMALSGLIEPCTIHADNVGIIEGLSRGEEGCLGLEQKCEFVEPM